MNQLEIKRLNTWIEISESAYKNNLTFFRKLVGPTVELSAVVKSNAYGHGWLPVAQLAVKYGATSFCVHSIEEALQLRDAGFQQDILIMGHIPFRRLKEAVTHDFRLVLFNMETLKHLQEITRQTNQRIRVHLKLETGTYRQGIDETELPRFLSALQNNPSIKLEAIYTHFANIEDTTNHDYALYQLERFRNMASMVEQAGFPHIKKHTACSAAALLFPETHFDMVRLGISQYGLWPSRETFVSYKIKHTQNGEDVLRPIMTWKTRVTQLKWVPEGNCIGYGCTYQTTRKTRLAILPIGYSDGYDRELSNQGYVLIHGKRAPIRGRVCMNLTMVDVTDIPDVKLEDEVVLLGQQGNERITADQIASWLHTINYEVVTRINWNIPRFIVD